MKFDFESIMDRHGKDSIAVDVPAGFGPQGETKPGFDRIPMWVADMNFPTAPSIQKEIIKRTEHPAFGYFRPTEAYFKAIADWQKQEHGVDVVPENIGYQNGVLGGVLSALNVMCTQGDNVLVHSPTYVGFTHALGNAGYHIVHSPLVKDEEEVWRMDYVDMEEKIVKNHIHAAIVCNPHNPCGRVWSREELEKAMEIFERHQVKVVSDEIWSDLILEGHTQVPTQSVNEYAKFNTVAEYAPSKTFNLAGLVGSYDICYDPWLRDRINKESALSHYDSMNVLWMHAMIGAYSEEGTEWKNELCSVLSRNVDYAVEYIRTHFKGVTLAKPEGTYMLFLHCEDWCREHDMDMDTLQRKGVEVGVLWQDGRGFHDPWGIRMNLAVPYSRVVEAFDRLDKYVFNA